MDSDKNKQSELKKMWKEEMRKIEREKKVMYLPFSSA